MKHVRGNLQLMKEMNRATILSLLQRQGVLSRAEIAQITRLSPTTISSLVEQLINEGFIVETGEKSSAGAGRKAIALEISRNQGFIIAIGLGYRGIYCALFNFHSEIITELTIPPVKGNDNVLHSIIEGIQEIVNNTGITDFSQIKGIGISSTGIVEESSGTVIYSKYLQLDNFNIGKLIRMRFGLPVSVMNDTNAAAFAEYYLKTIPEIRNVLYVWIHDGVGVSLILNGQINSGFQGRAGEVTFIKDNFISPYVLSKARKKATSSASSKMPNDIEDVLKMYEEGTDFLEPMMSRILMILSKSIADMINFIGPEYVVLDGWFIHSPKCMQQIQHYLDKFTLPAPYEASRVVPAKLGEKNDVIGAATMVLNRLFKGEVLLP